LSALPLPADALRSLAETKDDTKAYRVLLSMIVAPLDLGDVLLLYRDGEQNIKAIATSTPDARTLTADEAIGVLNNEAAILSAFGLSDEYCLPLPLAGAIEGIPRLILGRDDRPFSDGEQRLAEELVAWLSPLVAARYRQAEAEQRFKKCEERLDALFEESRDLIYTVDGSDTITSINTAGLALLGLRERDDALGKEFASFVYVPADRSEFLQKIKSQNYIGDYEIILKKAEGAPIFCIESAQAIKSPSGEIVELQGIIKDISERILRERELWKTSMELAAANTKLKEAEVIMVQHEKLASIGQLAAGVAHEINNPLGFLMSNHAVLIQFSKTINEAWNSVANSAPGLTEGIGKRLELDYVFGETAAILSETSDGLERIMAIVKNLKSFARAEMDTAICLYEINKGIENTLVVARNEIKYVADVDLRLGAVPSVEVAAGEINQVLLNLLVNAAQAIGGQKRKEKGRIVIETRKVGERVVCEISDDGPGVPDELRHRIFDPFFTTKEPGKGTGLGLSISYDIIVKKHGGGLSVERSPSGGALFRIELPILHPRPVAKEPSEDAATIQKAQDSGIEPEARIEL
jgi:two-component system, NtrC family, sensor kinase